MRLNSGVIIDVLNLRLSDIRIEDIAHHLSLANRFAGATDQPVSVAQHSVYVSQIAERIRGRGDWAALQGLLHDGSEYILGDVTKWLKQQQPFDGYRVAEDYVQRRIFERFSVPLQQHDAVTLADQLMVRREAEYFWGGHWSDVPGYQALSAEERELIGPWEPIDWKDAKARFLDRFDELWPGELG